MPLYVITDRDTQFELELLAELSAMVDFHRLRSFSYHAQTNRKIEMLYRVLKAFLGASRSDWLLSHSLVLSALCRMSRKDGIPHFLLVTGKAPLFYHGLLPAPPPTVATGADFIKKFIC